MFLDTRDEAKLMSSNGDTVLHLTCQLPLSVVTITYQLPLSKLANIWIEFSGIDVKMKAVNDMGHKIWTAAENKYNPEQMQKFSSTETESKVANKQKCKFTKSIKKCQ